MPNQKNNIFIISGPSGVGEDSVIERLKKILPIERVVTATTRPMRPGEKQGSPYYFITKAEFEKKIKLNGFFEYAQEYNDNYYGVTHEEINRVRRQKDKIGIWKIEYKGVISAKKIMPEIVAIFLNASLADLEKRIRRRSSVTDEYIKERMAYTEEWLEHRDVYDYEIENREGELEKTVKKVAQIIKERTNIAYNAKF
ncbi:guanylate kinase [Candidatus Falkowbacteria bacterium CG10_big_fil_rev_8_21_14_0_10_43_10]|uniref:Guanylate kinase n=1 Tax=Candidatus Falkowbacteria bacterium CG10_big_fil_rev_8_21_14_0_10_43_10 TaxID=1974567 RepID=A0A2H0V3V1_9BACT|nr:MAG: guanylate kinase [Candidatus Falkowbacteria bacterium CG10_big_fil_rev_8_21_14_0_10_43_10]